MECTSKINIGSTVKFVRALKIFPKDAWCTVFSNNTEYCIYSLPFGEITEDFSYKRVYCVTFLSSRTGKTVRSNLVKVFTSYLVQDDSKINFCISFY